MKTLSHVSKPLMYILFENFYVSMLKYLSYYSVVLFSDSLALSSQSLTEVPKEDQIHFAEERFYDAPLEKRIAGDLLYCNQKLFHYLFSNLKFLCSGALGKLGEVTRILSLLPDSVM